MSGGPIRAPALSFQPNTMYKEFFNGIEPAVLIGVGKKVVVPTTTVGILIANMVNQFLNPIVVASILFVIFAMFLDVITGVIYHVLIKVPPDKFDKKKIFISVFQFSLLIGLICLMVLFKIMVLVAEDSPIGWIVTTLDGGITGLFMTFLLIVSLCLIYDFAKRGKEMGMPGAAVIMGWLKSLINKFSKPSENAVQQGNTLDN